MAPNRERQTTTFVGDHSGPWVRAIPSPSCFDRAASVADGLGFGDPGVLQNVRGRPEALRAVTAILRAQTGFHVDQVVEFDAVAEILPAHPRSGGNHVQELVVAAAQHRQELVTTDGLST